MNTIFSAQTWHLLGWTMLHFLWLGTAVLFVAAIIRRVLRRAGPNVRYTHSLATLVALAALPLATATWLVPPPPSAGEGLAEGETLAVRGSPDPALVATAGLLTAPPETIELNPDYNPPTELRAASPPPSGGEGTNTLANSTAPTLTLPLRGRGPILSPPEGEGRGGGVPAGFDRALAFIPILVPYLPYFWLLGTPITFALLATGLIGAERMRRHGTPLTDGPVHDACERLRRSLHITRHVALAVCDRVAQPVLVGVVRPLILLPPVALTGWSPEELEMVLLHELAHVRRWDNLINLAQRVIESLLFFHPAVWIASTWVRRDREECCDAVVVTRTAQPKQYAELLLSLATHQPLAGLALARHPLAGRLRRILKLEDEPMLVSRNTIALLVVIFAIAAGIGYGPLRALGDGQPEAPVAAPPTDELPADAPPADTQPLAIPPSAPGSAGGPSDSPPPPSTNDPFAADRPAEPGADSEQPARYPRRYKIPDQNTAELGKLEKWLRSSIPMNAEAHWGNDGFLIFTATKEEHDRFVKVLNDISPPKLPFLSLEDQKIADRAYKLLGVELEPLSQEELAAVAKLGFEGGLRVSSSNSAIQEDDLLVGLHVWPTKDLQSLNEVLTRGDLAEFSPLKFYVVRQHVEAVPIEGRDGEFRNTKVGNVVTGRIVVDLEQLRAARQFDPPTPPYSAPTQPAKPTKQPAPATLPEWPSPPSADSNVYQQQPPAKAPVVVPTPALPFGQPEAVPPDAPGQPYPPTSVLSSTQPVPSQGPVASTPYISDISPAPGAREPVYRYDGKTFQEWRDLWKHELSTERRIEAVKALAAFGRAGYGKEAAEAILDVAGEYDFSYTEVQSAAEDKLMQTVLDVLAPENHRRSLDQYWFPSLVARLEKEPAKWNWLAGHLFDRLRTDNEEAVEMLRSLAQTGPAEVRGDALVALVRSSRLRSGGLQIDDETQGLLTAALESKDKTMVQSALSLLIYPRSPYGGDPSHQQLVFQPELIPLLFHRDKDIQQQARLVLREIQDKDAPQVVESLGNVLEDESRQADHLAAVRALGAVGPAAASAVPQLESLLEDAKDVELRVAAGFAIDGIESGVRGRNALSRQADDSEDEKAQTQYTRLINAEEEIMQLQSRRRFGN